VAVADICVAMDSREKAAKVEGGGAGDETTFVDVVLWDRMAENAEQFLRKGSGVLVEGRLHQDSWKDKTTGQTRRKLRVIGERMRFVGGGNHPGGREGTRRQNLTDASAEPR
jgi:single-strand DNA-binding protein